MKNLILFLLMGLSGGSAYGATSPSIDVPITISSFGPTPPAASAAAGFTTLALNTDFSRPQYAVQANWLDCSGTDTTHLWHFAYTQFPCNVNQGIDPVTRDTVMDFHWLKAYEATPSTFYFQLIQTLNEPANSQVTDFGNSYFETVMRQDVNLDQGGPNAFWAWMTNSVWSGGNDPGPLEPDFVELYGNSGFPFGDGSVINHSNGTFQKTWWSNASGFNGNVPTGWTTTDYHKYGMLITSDGGTATYACGYIDDVLQSCGNVNATPLQMRDRYLLKVWCGGNANTPGDEHCYVKYVRVWSCAKWNTQGSPPYTNPTSPAQCNGSTLFNDGSLIYWH